MMQNRDPYKVDMLVKMLAELKADEYFHPQVVAHGKLEKGIKNINLDEGAVRILIKYYGG